MKVFDKLMELPILRIFNPFYKKYKEMLLYLFFGGLSFIVSIATYACFNVGMGINELIANILYYNCYVCISDESCLGISVTD